MITHKDKNKGTALRSLNRLWWLTGGSNSRPID